MWHDLVLSRSQASADPLLVVSGDSSKKCFREGRLSQSQFPVSAGYMVIVIVVSG